MPVARAAGQLDAVVSSDVRGRLKRKPAMDSFDGRGPGTGSPRAVQGRPGSSRAPQAVAGGVFISYRRGDSAGHAGRLYDRLSTHFGEPQVFMDIDGIEPGIDFVESLRQAVQQCRVLVAVIGPDWLAATDAHGSKRLSNSGDFVRMEIVAALERGIRVIPVLVQDATMPAPDDLPEALVPLASRNALELSDARWSYDVGRLIDVVERVFRESDVEAAPAHPVAQAPTVQGRLAQWFARMPVRKGVMLSVVAAVAAVSLLASALLRNDLFGLPFTASRQTSSDSTEVGGDPSAVRNGTIAFVSEQSDGVDIRAMEPGGSDSLLLADVEGEVTHPDWSPDGTRIVFISDRIDEGNPDGDVEIWVMNADGSELEQLTDNQAMRDGAPDWSPDGNSIAFSRQSEDGDTQDIWVMDADGLNPLQLTQGHDNDAPDWSPDGQQLVFESDRDGDHDIWVMDAGGRNARQLLDNDREDFWPVWSPDGERVAYRSNRDGVFDIYTVAADGTGGITRLTADAAKDHRPAWSPDGRFITFDKSTANGQHVYVMAADGSSARPLRQGPAADRSPAWQPLPEG